MIPAYNEAHSIQRVIQSIPRKIPGIDKVEVLLVDDGSADKTSEFAHEAGADHVYRHAKNFGVVHAFKNGLTKALDKGADIIVNIDADGQFDAEEIPMLVAPVLSGKADVVLGSRFSGSSYRRVPLIKRIGNIIISLIVSLLSAQRIRDTQCGFRTLSRTAAEKTQLSGLFTYTQEMILMLSFKRMRLVELPISVRYFADRESRVVKNISRYTFKVLGVLLVTIIRRFWRYFLLIMTCVFALIVPLVML